MKRLVLCYAPGGREGVQTVVLPPSFVIPRSKHVREAFAVEELVSAQLVDDQAQLDELAKRPAS